MQPVPSVTREDVERVIRRDFAAVDPALVVTILNEHRDDGGETSGRYRVHLAALKLANGDLEQLREHVRISNQDYRDVLSAAEYPMATTRWRAVDKMSAEERQKIYDADWKQYQDWLNQTPPR
jgi:hypothetical protein